MHALLSHTPTQWKREVNEAVETLRGTSLECVPSAGSRLLNLTKSILSQRLDEICRDMSLWRDQVLSPDLQALTMLETPSLEKQHPLETIKMNLF